jgi:cell division protein ZapA (FtsZ GTPase activity inhibitor)
MQTREVRYRSIEVTIAGRKLQFCDRKGSTNRYINKLTNYINKEFKRIDEARPSNTIEHKLCLMLMNITDKYFQEQLKSRQLRHLE